MEISNKILHSYAIYCRKEMVKIFKCYLIPKKVMTLCPRVQFFLANPVYIYIYFFNRCTACRFRVCPFISSEERVCWLAERQSLKACTKIITRGNFFFFDISRYLIDKCFALVWRY